MDPVLEEAVATQTSALTSYATKALLITDLSVVRDPTRTTDPCDAVASQQATKVWSIGHMLKKEAERRGKTPNAYVSAWLDAWASTATVNGQSPVLNLLSGPSVRPNWPKSSQNEYLLHKAPFKLLAIVSRLDLRTFRPLGEPLGGEIRFIFAPIYGTSLATPSPDARCITAADDNSTIILEYSPARGDENAVVAWAKRWHALGSMSMGPSYRAALATLTEEVLNSGRLLRIRTNEGPNGIWQLTEFEHNGSGFLARSTIKQSPTEALHSQSSASLGIWMRDNQSQLQGLKPQPRTFRRAPVAAYALPDVFPGTSTYLRGSVNVRDGSSTTAFWNATNPGLAPIAWQETRHLFSLATCSGCHGGETNTGFLHVKNYDAGPASLSDFLKGPITVNDPVSGSSRQFNEMARREEDLNWLVTDGWVGVPVVRNSHAGGQSAAANYKMVFEHSLKCLDVEQSSQSDNALIKQYACHGGDNQRIAIVAAANGSYNLVVKHSQKCLDVENKSTANLARVVQRPCDNSSSQRVALSLSASRTARVLWFEHSGKCLQVQNLSTSDAAPLVQETCPAVFPDNRAFEFVE